ncbi:hypothetical protein ACDX78_02010 [Virgibacillus oceani]
MRYLNLIIITVLFLAACGDTGETIDENASETDRTGSVNLRNVEVEVEDLEVEVTGEASTASDEFYYRVEEEGNVIIEETHMGLEESQSDWSNFEIILDLTENYANNEEPPIIVLYGKNSEGDMINPNHIPVDL